MVKNYFLFSLLFIAFSAVLYAFFIKPQYYVGRSKYEKVAMLRDVIVQGEELQRTRDNLQDRINAISPQKTDLIENAIPVYSPENVVLFLRALEKLMYDKSGLPLDVSYSLGAEQVASDTVVLPITFNFTIINYRTLGDFMSGLQSWSRGMRIQSLQISSSADREAVDLNTVRATIIAEALFASVSEPGTL